MKKRNIKRRIIIIIFGVVILVGVGILLYPTISNWWNQLHASYAISSYNDNISKMEEKQAAEMLEKAEEYNKTLLSKDYQYSMSKANLKEYNSLLDIDKNGMIGYITIPKINVELPIYHGTDESTLQVAVGHLEWSSLPVGGKGTHAVLSGHRGLPSAQLFTSIDQLEKGDTFTITVLNRTITYQVCDIIVVLPEELDNLKIEEGKDLCTLVTCTPYGINTHRLLVTGERVPNAVTEEKETQSNEINFNWVYLLLLCIII